MSDDESDEFWRFAIAVYGAPGVSDECLAAQNENGCDVCMLLAAAFSALEGRLPDASTLAQWDGVVAAWRSGIVRPLRAVRDTLKPRQEQPTVARLRKSVLADELEAERIELTMLAAARQQTPAPAAPEMALEDRLVKSLRQACALYTDALVTLPNLVGAVLAYAEQPEG